MADAPRVLLTGSSGGVGRVAQLVLADAGWNVRPFDLGRGPTVALRPVMILDDQGLAAHSQDSAELGAYVHVDDVAAATLLALSADLHGHHRLTLCGPGSFDTSCARTTLGWTATRTWEHRRPP